MRIAVDRVAVATQDAGCAVVECPFCGKMAKLRPLKRPGALRLDCVCQGVSEYREQSWAKAHARTLKRREQAAAAYARRKPAAA